MGMWEGGIEGELTVSFLTAQVSRCCTHMNLIVKRRGGGGGEHWTLEGSRGRRNAAKMKN